MKSLLAAIFLIATPMLAHAETLMTCDGPKGHSYTFEGGLIPAGETKPWSDDDGMPKGSVSLTRSGSDLDLIITDASGATYSARADGAKVLTVSEHADGWVVVALYEHALETYSFSKTSRGGEMVVSMTKFDTLVNKGALYQARCRAGN